MADLTAADLTALFGRAVPDTALAEYLGVDVRTLRKYSTPWGGVPVAPGRQVFFENRIREVIQNAQPLPEEWQKALAGKRHGERKGISPLVPRRDQGQRKSGGLMGGRRKEEPGNPNHKNDPYNVMDG